MASTSPRLCRCSNKTRRRDRVVARRDASWAAAATLVALSALYYRDRPARARPGRVLVQNDVTEVAIEKNREDEKRGAPWPARPDCTAGRARTARHGRRSGGRATARTPNRYFRGTSTVWKWTCQGTELTNKDGCLQCETYSPAWGAVSPILAASPCHRRATCGMAVPNPS